jgi:hypothetical protein
MNQEVRKRLKWVKLYQKLGNAGTVCLRCGIFLDRTIDILIRDPDSVRRLGSCLLHDLFIGQGLKHGPRIRSGQRYTLQKVFHFYRSVVYLQDGGSKRSFGAPIDKNRGGNTDEKHHTSG